MPNHRLIQLAKERVLPHLLAVLKEKPPICASCNYGQAHKQPCRTKGKHTNTIRYKDDFNPGDCVSIDQILSAQPGLVPQMSGYLTSDRIWGITLFLDHATYNTYGHLMRSLDLDETLGSKKSFENLVSRSYNTVKIYHEYNRRYVEKISMASLNANNHTITFCGVGAHHQNGIVERSIWTVTGISRTIFLHDQ